MQNVNIYFWAVIILIGDRELGFLSLIRRHFTIYDSMINGIEYCILHTVMYHYDLRMYCSKFWNLDPQEFPNYLAISRRRRLILMAELTSQ